LVAQPAANCGLSLENSIAKHHNQHMSDEDSSVHFAPPLVGSMGSASLFEEEEQAWETLLSVTLEIRESLQEINRKLDLRADILRVDL
jgi:hypothetical protein